jgi:hypothetical protein
MGGGELWTRWTIRLALLCYAAALGWWLSGRGQAADRGGRCMWTTGLALYLAHVIAAFHFYHRWSHAAAWEETARQTAEVTGLAWGGGIWFNYAFALVWGTDCLWQWAAALRGWRRPAWWRWAVHLFMAFMVVNATIVFESGATRWVALAIALALASIGLAQPRPFR